ncbi:MAG: hypothetical protein ABIP48_19505, partial [Planctomycetota bacterium]
MKPFLALLGIAILSSSLEGAVAEGENLLINGGFDAEQVDFPEFWSLSSAKALRIITTGTVLLTLLPGCRATNCPICDRYPNLPMFAKPQAEAPALWDSASP